MPSITLLDVSGNIVKQFPADLKKTLLSQLTDAGVEIPNACRAGLCGACICQIEWGEKVIDKSKITEPGFPLADEEVMTCIAGLGQDVTEDIVLKMIY